MEELRYHLCAITSFNPNVPVYSLEDLSLGKRTKFYYKHELLDKLHTEGFTEKKDVSLIVPVVSTQSFSNLTEFEEWVNNCANHPDNL